MRPEGLNKGQFHTVKTVEFVQAHCLQQTVPVLKNTKSSRLALISTEQKGNQGIHR